MLPCRDAVFEFEVRLEGCPQVQFRRSALARGVIWASLSQCLRQTKNFQLWREQCRRQIARQLSARLKYGFVRARNREHINRSFTTMSEYRAWCEQHHPAYLGYGRA